MFGSRHYITVVLGPRARGYQYECSCGARGWTSPTRYLARQAGEKHRAAKAKGH